jgi:Trypsin-like peptidase domain
MARRTPGVLLDRVVAVVAELPAGQEQIGSGYLVSGRSALTAEHCTRDKSRPDRIAKRLKLVRPFDGASAEVTRPIVRDTSLDVAVLRVEDAPWNADFPPLAFARVDRTQAGKLEDCTGVGFPLFQRDPLESARGTAEVHGTVYQTDERETGRLLMREPLIRPGPMAQPHSRSAVESVDTVESPWGGLSGTLVFYEGHAIGVVVEHHPRQGDNAIRMIGFDRIASSDDIRRLLALATPEALPWATEEVAQPGALSARRGDFADLIEQGVSMIRRLEQHVGLSYGERTGLPVEQQVTHREASEWNTAVERRVTDLFGDDVARRLTLAHELYADEANRAEGDEVDRALNLWRRLVLLLRELEEIPLPP